MQSDTIALLRINQIAGLSLTKIHQILAKVPNPAMLLELRAKDLQHTYGIPEQLSQFIISNLHSKATETATEKELQLMEKHQVQLCSILEPHYPRLLKETTNPPVLLYSRGKVDCNQSLLLSIVGARRATYYGCKQTKQFVYELAQKNIPIAVVSGLALGIDTVAHQSALKNNIPTIAVLANGLSHVYPSKNQDLAEQIIASGGLILSEKSMNSRPLPVFFPQRNRIISGLSRAVMVMEATLRSGSLITARYALEQNREIFALPGPIDAPNYQGCFALLDQQKAQLLTSIDRVLDALLPIDSNLQPNNRDEKPKQQAGEKSASTQGSLFFKQQFNQTASFEPPTTQTNHSTAEQKAIFAEHPLAKEIWSILLDQPADLDYLVKKIAQPTEKILACLIQMQIVGVITEKTPGSYCCSDNAEYIKYK